MTSLSLQDFDAKERDLILQLHEEHPEFSTEELIERVGAQTRAEWLAIWSQFNSPQQHDAS
jgi:hypothetical protein